MLVANDVPAPHQIDDAWLVQHDWILRRVILDDSFRPALRYLAESFVGAETNIRNLQANAEAQKAVVDSLGQQFTAQDRIIGADQQDVLDAVRALGSSQQQQGMLDIVKRIFDPRRAPTTTWSSCRRSRCTSRRSPAHTRCWRTSSSSTAPWT
ncbi:hypothetical protein [Dactylosporangium darangshiense]|uniref:Uncharacterized protein n=1 Tax=Dactylosporangium darangshiense TaxID=579108 RepID=A0ABP8DHI2_9ACTN